MTTLEKIAGNIGKAYLFYLSLLPAVGTFLLFFVFQTRINPMLFFLLGTAAIGIYLAFTGSYTVLTKSVWKNLVLLLDGPVWMGISLFFGGSLATAFVNDVIAEMGGVLLSVFLVVCTSTIPTRSQRIQSFFAVGLPLLGLFLVYFTFAREQQIPWMQGGYIVTAMIQGALVQYRLGLAMDVQREPETYILIGILSWMFAFCILWPVLQFVLVS